MNTAGVTAFNGAVGGATALASLTTDAPGTTDLNGGVVNTIGTQTYNDPVLLTADTVLTAQFGGDHHLCKHRRRGLRADREHRGGYGIQRRGRRRDGAASLTTDAPGTTDLNGGVVNTIGTQTYNDPVLLTADTVLTSQFGGNTLLRARSTGPLL